MRYIISSCFVHPLESPPYCSSLPTPIRLPRLQFRRPVNHPGLHPRPPIRITRPPALFSHSHFSGSQLETLTSRLLYICILSPCCSFHFVCLRAYTHTILIYIHVRPVIPFNCNWITCPRGVRWRFVLTFDNLYWKYMLIQLRKLFWFWRPFLLIINQSCWYLVRSFCFCAFTWRLENVKSLEKSFCRFFLFQSLSSSLIRQDLSQLVYWISRCY